MNVIFPSRARGTLLATSLACLCLVPATDAVAEDLASNLGESPSGNHSPLFGQWYASPFVTDARQWSLTSVTFTLDPGQFPEPQVAFARIHEDDGTGKPGALLAELVNPGGLNFGPPGDYVFAAPPGVMLEADTQYLVVLGSQVPPPGTADQRAFWVYTDSVAWTGPGTLPGGTVRSFDQGASWGSPLTERHSIFAVQAEPIETVPLLGPGALGGLAALLLGSGSLALARSQRS
jgi:hypothetical protein